MIKSPHVVVKAQYTPSYNNLTYKFNNKDKIKNDVMLMFDYYADEKKKLISMFDYFDGTIGKDEKMNLCLENGEYATKQEKEQRQKRYCKYIENSNVYKLIISFPENYLESNVDIRKFEKILAKDIIPKFLRKCGFVDIKQMSYQFSLHTNTKHLHFHISFCEKKPNYRCTDNSIKYRIKGKLSEKELNFLKNEVEHEINKEKIFTPLLVKTNKQIDDLKSYFREDDKNFILRDKEELEIESDILKLGELLYEIRKDNNYKIKYNSIKNKEITVLTNKIKKYIFSKKNPELNDKYKDFKSSLSDINNYFKTLSENNNIDYINNAFSQKKEKYLDNYVMNAIVNHAYKNYKIKIHENDILREIVYKNYKKNHNENRYHILKNYLSNVGNTRFINRYRINQSVMKINKELEEAEEEFYKLFREKDYSKQ